MRELPPEAVNAAADAIEAHPDWNLPYATAQVMARAALEAAEPVIRAQERQHVLWRLGYHRDRGVAEWIGGSRRTDVSTFLAAASAGLAATLTTMYLTPPRGWQKEDR